MSDPKDVAVGIDVAKAALDVAVRLSGEERHLANDAAGIADIVGWMQALSPRVIVVEATGAMRDDSPVGRDMESAQVAAAPAKHATPVSLTACRRGMRHTHRLPVTRRSDRTE